MSVMLILSCKPNPTLKTDSTADKESPDTFGGTDKTIKDLELKIISTQDQEDLETNYFLLLELIAERPRLYAKDFHSLLGLTLARDYSGANQLSDDLILDAARHFEEALRQYPTSDSLHLIMAQYLFGLITLDGSISHPYGTVQTTGERALESLKNALSHGAKPSECHYVEGNIYRFQNNFLDAIEAYRLSVSADPQFILAYEAGFNVSIELDYPDQAVSWLNEGIERNPSSYELANLLGHNFLGAGKEKLAVGVMEAYLKRNPEPPKKALYDYGYFLEKDKQIKQAGIYYLKAIEADTLNLDAYYRLGNLYEGQSEWKQAHETFSELLKRLPLNHAYHKEIRRTLETIERKL